MQPRPSPSSPRPNHTPRGLQREPGTGTSDPSREAAQGANEPPTPRPQERNAPTRRGAGTPRRGEGGRGTPARRGRGEGGAPRGNKAPDRPEPPQAAGGRRRRKAVSVRERPLSREAAHKVTARGARESAM